MSEVPEPADQQLRASDAEREQVVERLLAASGEGRLDAAELQERTQRAYAARNRAELTALLRDLPGLDPSVPLSSPAPPPRPAGSWPDTAPPVVAVFGGTERRGRWRPARTQTVLAVFGGAQIDLRDAELPPDELRLQAYAVFGGIEVDVPEGMRVELTGFALFGGRTVRTAPAPASTGPVLHLRGVALFGGVAAKSASRGW